jgi:hypothetical protein
VTLAEVLPALHARVNAPVVSLPPDVFGTIGVVSLLTDGVGAVVLVSVLLDVIAVGVTLPQAERAMTQIAMNMLKIIFWFISVSISTEYRINYVKLKSKALFTNQFERLLIDAISGKDEMEYIGLMFEEYEEDISFL